MAVTLSPLQEAAATLDQALRELGVERPRQEAIYWLLGLVYGESKFGTSPDWSKPDPKGLNTSATNPGIPDGPSHNWGAVRLRSGDKYILHGDRNADGSAGTFRFQWYPSAVEGAKGFLRTLLRGKVPGVLQAELASPYDLARAMYENGYYTGVEGTSEDRIQAYGNMIKNLADKVRKELGVTPGPLPQTGPSRPVSPVQPPSPPSPASIESAKGAWALGALLAGAYLIYKHRR